MQKGISTNEDECVGRGGGRRGRVLTRGHPPQEEATPLHLAAWNQREEVVQILLDAKADPEAREEVRRERGGSAHKRVWCCCFLRFQTLGDQGRCTSVQKASTLKDFVGAI